MLDSSYLKKQSQTVFIWNEYLDFLKNKYEVVYIVETKHDTHIELPKYFKYM